MADRWIKVSTEMCDHAALAGPYDKRSAWLWLIANAAWKNRRVSNKGKMVELQRGQILAGRAFLAKQWGWTEKKVRNFLAVLVAENMVKMGQSGGHYANVLTVCNYDRYQAQTDNEERRQGQSGASQGPVRGQSGARLLERVERVEGIERIDSPDGESSPSLDLDVPQQPEPDVLQQAVEVWNEAAAKAGLPKVRILSEARRKKLAARLKEAGGIDGWREAIGKLVASDFLTGKVKDWKADFGFVLQQESFARLVEGGYDNRRNMPRQDRLPASPNAVTPWRPTPEQQAQIEASNERWLEQDRLRRLRMLTQGPRLGEH